MCKHKVFPFSTPPVNHFYPVIIFQIQFEMQVISLVGAQKASLHPDDMLLLANFVMSSESFRQVILV